MIKGPAADLNEISGNIQIGPINQQGANRAIRSSFEGTPNAAIPLGQPIKVLPVNERPGFNEISPDIQIRPADRQRINVPIHSSRESRPVRPIQLRDVVASQTTVSFGETSARIDVRPACDQ